MSRTIKRPTSERTGRGRLNLYPGDSAHGLGQLEEARKFDQAARGRHRAEGLVRFAPRDQVEVTASYGTTQDDYRESEYGLLKDINYNYSLELTYDPHPVASLFAEYTREEYKYRQRSRQRSPGNPTRVSVDSPNSDWESDLRDRVGTLSAGVDASLSRKAVGWETRDFPISSRPRRRTIRTRAIDGIRPWPPSSSL